MSDLRPLAAIRTHKQVSRAALAKALALPAAKIEYFEDHAPLTTLEYLVNVKKALGLSWSVIGSILEESATRSGVEPAPLRGRGRPRKLQPQLSAPQLLTPQPHQQSHTVLNPTSKLSPRRAPELSSPKPKPLTRVEESAGPKRPRGRPRKQPITDTTLSALLGIK